MEFEILGRIGQGGFSFVYLAKDRSLQRTVALKEYMPFTLAMRAEDDSVSLRAEEYRETFDAGLRSFVNEARLLAQFDHPALLKVYRFWEGNGSAYMAMPYYEGITVREYVRTFPEKVSERWLKEMLEPVTDALQALHASHCYHRDISPDNVQLLKNGAPLLLDFGAARRIISDMTQAVTVILKPGYAPVEQYSDDLSVSQGPWTDIYALSAVVYFCIAGKAPMVSVARTLKDSLLPLRSIAGSRYTESFVAAIQRGLAVFPLQRPQSIAEFRALLELPPHSFTARSSSAATVPGSFVLPDETTTDRREPFISSRGWMTSAGADGQAISDRDRADSAPTSDQPAQASGHKGDEPNRPLSIGPSPIDAVSQGPAQPVVTTGRQTDRSQQADRISTDEEVSGLDTSVPSESRIAGSFAPDAASAHQSAGSTADLALPNPRPIATSQVPLDEDATERLDKRSVPNVPAFERLQASTADEAAEAYPSLRYSEQAPQVQRKIASLSSFELASIAILMLGLAILAYLWHAGSFPDTRRPHTLDSGAAQQPGAGNVEPPRLETKTGSTSNTERPSIDDAREREARIGAEARRVEEARRIEEAREEEARQAQEARSAKEAPRPDETQASQAQSAEDVRRAAERLNVDSVPKVQAARRADEVQKGEDARRAEEIRRTEQVRKAQDARKAQDSVRAEQTRRAGEARWAEEIRRDEDARRVEDARRAEDAGRAEEARQADEKRRAAESRRVEDARRAEEARQADEKRRAAESRRVDDARRAEEARQAEETRRAEEARRSEDARRAEEVRRAAEARKAEEQRKAQEAKKPRTQPVPIPSF